MKYGVVSHCRKTQTETRTETHEIPESVFNPRAHIGRCSERTSRWLRGSVGWPELNGNKTKRHKGTLLGMLNTTSSLNARQVHLQVQWFCVVWHRGRGEPVLYDSFITQLCSRLHSYSLYFFTSGGQRNRYFWKCCFFGPLSTCEVHTYKLFLSLHVGASLLPTIDTHSYLNMSLLSVYQNHS